MQNRRLRVERALVEPFDVEAKRGRFYGAALDVQNRTFDASKRAEGTQAKKWAP
jgi:hypothetical protein